jgi:hypothetical protein
VDKKGRLDFAGFQRFVKKIKRRPDIEQLYGQIAGENGGKFDFVAFEKFVREAQKVKLIDLESKPWLIFVAVAIQSRRNQTGIQHLCHSLGLGISQRAFRRYHP